MGIEADYELDDQARAHLAVLVGMDGFKILQHLMEDEVKKFNLKLINASKPEEVIHAHNLAKAASQFYQGVINRLNNEIDFYQHAPKVTDKPVDSTSQVLDLDDAVDLISNLPNLLEIEEEQ
jgi:hypothetical protein